MFDRTTAEKYDRAIHWVTQRAWRKTFRDEYTYEDLHALAMEVAAARHDLWDRGAFDVISDLRMHLWRAIRRDRYANGWRQEGSGRNRRWVPPARAGYLGDFADGLLGSWADEPYHYLYGEDNGATYPLMPHWPPFTPAQRRRFARVMEARFPTACCEFEAIDQEPKPPAMHNGRWQQNRRILRLRLLGKYAAELDEAMGVVVRRSGLRSVRAA